MHLKSLVPFAAAIAVFALVYVVFDSIVQALILGMLVGGVAQAFTRVADERKR